MAVPHDLINRILQFSPVKALLHFRCLSKSLCSFIDSPEFIKSHYITTNSNNRTHCKLIYQDSSTPGSNYKNPDPILVLDIDEYDPLDFRKEKHNSTDYIFDNHFAHCNGLVLFMENPHASDIVVWNPSTNKRRMLSILPTVSPPNDDEFGLRSYVNGLGIGYDSSTNDYKILLIKGTRVVSIEWSDGDYDTDIEYDFWILGLRSSGYWRKIKNWPKDLHYYGDMNGYRNSFVDNSFHFLGDSDIWAYDVTKETFSRISLPLPTDVDYMIKTQAMASDLQVLQGCLSVNYFFRKEKKLDLYVRKKNDDLIGGGGDEFYWTKLFCIERRSCLTFGSEISYLRDNEMFLLLLDDKYVLCSYDFKERSMRRIVVGKKRTQNVILCNESLVPVDYATTGQRTIKKRRQLKRKGSIYMNKSRKWNKEKKY